MIPWHPISERPEDWQEYYLYTNHHKDILGKYKFIRAYDLFISKRIGRFSVLKRTDYKQITHWTKAENINIPEE